MTPPVPPARPLDVPPKPVGAGYPHRLTDDERQRGLATLRARRKRRADIKRTLKQGEATFDQLWEASLGEPFRPETVDHVFLTMYVRDLVGALRWMGPDRTRLWMRRLHIDEDARVRDLSVWELDGLSHFFEVHTAPSWTCEYDCRICFLRGDFWRVGGYRRGAYGGVLVWRVRHRRFANSGQPYTKHRGARLA
jgi:hypothetical protein